MVSAWAVTWGPKGPVSTRWTSQVPELMCVTLQRGQAWRTRGPSQTHHARTRPVGRNSGAGHTEPQRKPGGAAGLGREEERRPGEELAALANC